MATPTPSHTHAVIMLITFPLQERAAAPDFLRARIRGKAVQARREEVVWDAVMRLYGRMPSPRYMPSFRLGAILHKPNVFRTPVLC